jgi:excinuclease UvrABC helicase subunit UvrB
MTQQLAIIISDSKAIHTQITEDRKAAFPEASLLKVFRRYYRGRQNATYTPAQNAFTWGNCQPEGR